jgi:hypothetical protein
MPTMPSVMGLHMRYRLWIAEMNYDINIIRILEDYLAELSPKDLAPDLKHKTEGFKKGFISLRKEIDDLRHEMHILKMNLAAYAREGKTITPETYKGDNHEAVEERFRGFKAGFETMKKDFEHLEYAWPH